MHFKTWKLLHMLNSEEGKKFFLFYSIQHSNKAIFIMLVAIF